MKKGNIPLECGTSPKQRVCVCDYVRNADNCRNIPGNRAVWHLGEVRRWEWEPCGQKVSDGGKRWLLADFRVKLWERSV